MDLTEQLYRDHVAGGGCSHREHKNVNGKLLPQRPCDKRATTVNYGDQGRYEYPVCWTHDDTRTGYFKGPEDL